MDAGAGTATETCYRHPNRVTGVSCSACGRPICPDCMTPTPVGMRCPECSRQKTQVRTIRTMSSDPQVTYALIVINVIVFVAQIATGAGGFDATSGSVYRNGALFGPLVAAGDWWRIVTSGFLHAGLLHIAFNMYFVYFLGNMLEPAIGKVRFAALYFVSLLGGSLGALLLSFDSPTVGASGAAFGLLAGAIILMRSRGINPMESGLVMLLVLNLGITFLLPGISVGGHLGGIVAGGIAALLLFEVGEKQRGMRQAALGATILLGAVIAVVCVVYSRSKMGI
jgi:membrane associated rhomboid family serine protease